MVRGIACTVVMPSYSPEIKRNAVAGYGARVVVVPYSELREATERERASSGAEFVHPSEDNHVIAGQGTAALEIIAEQPSLDAIIAPVGGGGLLSGTAIATRSLVPKAQIYGAEPEGADDAYRSLASGKLQPGVPRPDTIADGLLKGLGRTAFDVLSAAGAKVQLVSDAELVAAATFHLERMKLVVEPSGAAGLAALRHLAPGLAGQTVAVIISGGNTDFGWLPR